MFVVDFRDVDEKNEFRKQFGIQVKEEMLQWEHNHIIKKVRQMMALDIHHIKTLP